MSWWAESAHSTFGVSSHDMYFITQRTQKTLHSSCCAFSEKEFTLKLGLNPWDLTKVYSWTPNTFRSTVNGVSDCLHVQPHQLILNCVLIITETLKMINVHLNSCYWKFTQVWNYYGICVLAKEVKLIFCPHRTRWHHFACNQPNHYNLWLQHFQNPTKKHIYIYIISLYICLYIYIYILIM